MPISDIQYGQEACDIGRLVRHVKWGSKVGAYFLGLGDAIDFASPSNRSRLSSADLYDSSLSALDLSAFALADDLFETALKPSVGRWLGLIQGHHYWQALNQETTDTYLAKKLGAPFLGDSAFVQIEFELPDGTVPPVVATIWCHHGAGGGLTAASPLNRLERIVTAFDADIYLIGHQHKMATAPLDRLMVVDGRIVHKTIMIAGTGGFLRGYMQGSESAGRAQDNYVGKKMLTPTHLGGIVLYLRPVEEDGRWRLDISVHL